MIGGRVIGRMFVGTVFILSRYPENDILRRCTGSVAVLNGLKSHSLMRWMVPLWYWKISCLLSTSPMYRKRVPRSAILVLDGTFGVYPSCPNTDMRGNVFLWPCHSTCRHDNVDSWIGKDCLNEMYLTAYCQYVRCFRAAARIHRLAFMSVRLTRSAIPFSSGLCGIVERGPSLLLVQPLALLR